MHRLELGELVGIFTLADRRVIARDLVDAVVAKLVQPRVADMADHGAHVVDDDDGQDARHPVPLRPQDCGAMDLVVRDRDRFAHAIDKRSRLALEPRPQHRQRDIGGSSAGRVAADAIDDHEQPSRQVEVDAIFIDVALQAGVGVRRRSKRGGCLHRVAHSAVCDR